MIRDRTGYSAGASLAMEPHKCLNYLGRLSQEKSKDSVLYHCLPIMRFLRAILGQPDRGLLAAAAISRLVRPPQRHALTPSAPTTPFGRRTAPRTIASPPSSAAARTSADDYDVTSAANGRVTVNGRGDEPRQLGGPPLRLHQRLFRVGAERQGEGGYIADFDGEDGHLIWYYRHVPGTRESVTIEVRSLE